MVSLCLNLRTFVLVSLSVLVHFSVLAVRTASTEPKELVAPPAVFLDTTISPESGRVFSVRTTGDFQVALNTANFGDTIELEAGASLIGNFTLPAKPASEGSAEGSWITIRSSAPDSDLPPPGTRISPSFAVVLPKLAGANGTAVVSAARHAHHYRFIGVEFTLSERATFSYGLIRLGEGDETEVSQLPHDIVIDRCYIHGNKTASLRRGIALNSATTAVINSYISDCHENGADSQAICGWNGPGPFKIVNNYLEAAGENVMFGGADPKIQNLIPSDIEFRLNHCYKPLAWKINDSHYAGRNWSVKNLLELKNAQRVLIEGNLFENSWLDAQTGYAVLFKSVNQEGTAPWSVTQDVEFRNNIVRHCSGGLNIQGRAADQPGGQTKRISIKNNLFDDVNGVTWGGEGCFLKITESQSVTVDHNTVIQSGNIITAYGEPNKDFVFTNTLAAHNVYGIKGDGAGEGNNTLDIYFPNIVFKKNVIAGSSTSIYPYKNFFPASLDDIGFVDRIHRNYRLASGSRFKYAGTKGRDVGADIDALEAALSGS